LRFHGFICHGDGGFNSERFALNDRFWLEADIQFQLKTNTTLEGVRNNRYFLVLVP
jgi:hypothetical protein